MHSTQKSQGSNFVIQSETPVQGCQSGISQQDLKIIRPSFDRGPQPDWPTLGLKNHLSTAHAFQADAQSESPRRRLLPGSAGHAESE
jgi:hypothetical protein